MKKYILDEKIQLNYNSKKIEYIINNECWECVSHNKGDGYALITRHGKHILMHRYIYELYNECEIPKEMVIMHTCDNPKCINPKHLKLGTQQDNMIDMKNKCRRNDVKMSNSKKKLSENDVLDIKKMLIDGLSLKDISLKYNMTPQSIGSIKNGKSTYSKFLNGGLKDWIKEK